MGVLSSADGSTGSAVPEPVEELAGRVWATGAGARSLCARWLSLSGAAFGGGSAMTEHAVVIAGGGPTGLMLAGELALAGVDVVIVERRASKDLDGSEPGGLHSRTIEVLDQRGIAERFLSAGQEHPALGYSGILLGADLPGARRARPAHRPEHLLGASGLPGQRRRLGRRPHGERCTRGVAGQPQPVRGRQAGHRDGQGRPSGGPRSGGPADEDSQNSVSRVTSHLAIPFGLVVDVA